MCNFLFLASSRPLPLLPAREEELEFYVTELKDREKSVLEWFSEPNAYFIGSYSGCSCPFECEYDWDDPDPDELEDIAKGRRDFSLLASYLRQAVQEGAKLQLYNAWDYWLPPVQVMDLKIDSLMQERFVFSDRQLYHVVR
ncbi:hypothetical protein [Deinococcus humi]|uniref:Uncharacterized protein n=1 Tax=Deinococcus humi TaxID=662880 RepID=A0A7W8JZJ4_9DEIO|nr:hypothetical protein [Deinococcus humi]MBB5366127.1 hypothetical protein [Deinococcus humi]GGO40210.1 hypothetical protein GCM10008949_49440 [Deinococcus humi]